MLLVYSPLGTCEVTSITAMIDSRVLERYHCYNNEVQICFLFFSDRSLKRIFWSCLVFFCGENTKISTILNETTRWKLILLALQIGTFCRSRRSSSEPNSLYCWCEVSNYEHYKQFLMILDAENNSTEDRV